MYPRPIGPCRTLVFLTVCSLSLTALIGLVPKVNSQCTETILFDPSFDIATGQNPHFTLSADFNEDGIMDLAVANSFVIATGGTGADISILIGKGAAGVGDGTFEPKVDYQAGQQPYGLATGDFNEDGILDLVAANFQGLTVNILFGQGAGGVGDGTFSAPVSYAAGQSPFHVITGDFNEDDILDLAVANNSAPTVTILLGQGTAGVGDGTFAAPVPYTISNLSTSIASGDFNEDGITDLVASANFSGTVAVLLGQGAAGVGDGTFVVDNHYSAGIQPFQIAIEDYNEDGILDMAVANGNTGGTAILIGNGIGGVGDGTFALPYFLPTGNSTGIATDDFNGDGINDLAVATSTSFFPTPVEIHLGNGIGGVGDGTFGNVTDYMVGKVPLHISVSDFNEDGKLDLVVSNWEDDHISILFGTCRSAPPPPNPSPELTGVHDVPNDQGGKVFLTWTRSSFDIPNANVTAYRVWRRLPTNLAAGDFSSALDSGADHIRATETPSPYGVNQIVYWEAIAELPVQRLVGYGFAAPTTQDSLPDSNPFTAFFVTAITADRDVFYDSNVDSGYSVDNLSPAVPQSLIGAVMNGDVVMHWRPNQESDLSHYSIYRGETPDFVPS